MGFYFCCKHLLGWWMPSSPLADPDVNATLAPWLPPIAQVSAQAATLCPLTTYYYYLLLTRPSLPASGRRLTSYLLLTTY